MDFPLSLEPHDPEESLLLQEMAHRFCNELTSAICAISVAISGSRNERAREALTIARDRLYATAQVQRILQGPAPGNMVDTSEYLGSLCEAISRARLRDRGVELVFVDNGLKLDSARCWRLALIVSELITIAARHGLDGRSGTIRVELRKTGQMLECIVADNGQGSDNPVQGRGTKIITALTDRLAGRFQRRFGARGSISVVRFPERVAPDAQLSA